MKTLKNNASLFCIPMVGTTIQELRDEASYIKEMRPDFIEWRIDAYRDPDHLPDAFQLITELRQNGFGMIFTPRDVNEGGFNALSSKERLSLIDQATALNLCDYVDIESRSTSSFKEQVNSLLGKRNIPLIYSYHNFIQTPELSEIESLLEAGIQEGQVEKFAFMPKNREDLKNLMVASDLFRKNHPDRLLILIAMGEIGEESRIFPEKLNSSLSFASGLNSSAPGQVDLSKIRIERRDKLC